MKYSFLALVAVLFMSCNDKKKEENITPAANTEAVPNNEAEIVKYIADNHLKATRTESGLYYVIEEAGTGKQPTVDSEVTVAYKGYFTNKEVFDQSDKKGISFPLRGVIAGWTEGIQYFKEGGKGILLIPSDLGYGPGGQGPIPGGSVLVFDIKLNSVK
ncbi:FKBP-type peptidyl-prolyl cis-trans isomerase [Flavobacterium sp. 5]|uniref:FKBP-type peptidyl-prolyl cis-trans isomerase n=1 Tax=Flavobacterium sp. 5 TaxID=2035199 RepID=UPI000C2CD72D|nr:FKBP-type peptidyl-prolyl cis-trans isomerase [Flavobacterium sp. 5]PKB16627.1 FKBP-type peptidyl-prolyl cis-trans isomerase FkpA [Flavobacterium sp. 5]